LYIRKGVTLKPSVFGGGQEKNIRSGTENVGAIAGFGTACTLIDYSEAQMTEKIKNYLKEELLKTDGAVLNGGGKNESPYILNISFGKIRSEIMLNALSNEGIYVSSGSACSSGAKLSHVLSEMNAEKGDSAIRLSLSRYNTMEEAQEVVLTINKIAKELRV
jgi:cysteine desulfurase